MFTIAIQAGGRSKRFGRNNALARFDGKRLIASIVARVRPLAEELLVIINHPEEYDF